MSRYLITLSMGLGSLEIICKYRIFSSLEICKIEHASSQQTLESLSDS